MEAQIYTTTQEKELLKNLLNRRFGVVEKVGAYKKARNLPVYDAERWQQVIEKIKQAGEKVSIPAPFIETIWNEIHKTALKIEENIRITKDEVEELNLDELRKEINEIDTLLVENISQFYKQVGERKTREIISSTLKSIALAL